MQKIIEQLNQWSYLHQLPQTLQGFALTLEQTHDGTQYRLFSYYNSDKDRLFTVLYDHATKEYIARWRLGLTEFCDVNFIAPNLSMLENLLSTRLDNALRSMAVFNPASLGSVFLAKKIIDWPYAKQLPDDLCGFGLAVSPLEPLKGINGSYIILDYSDFSTKTRLLVYYNIYRDEFYGEIIFRGTPEMITCFDSNTLPELEDKLKTSLMPLLVELRQRIKNSE